MQFPSMAFFFEARTWTGDITNCAPDKCAELRWFPLDGLPETAMVPYIRDAIASHAAGNGPELTSTAGDDAADRSEPSLTT